MKWVTWENVDFICRGIRTISADDHTAMERGRLIYDALYGQLSVQTAFGHS